MNRNTIKRLVIVTTFSALIFISGCFIITMVDQPTTAQASTAITLSMDVTLDERDYGAGGGPSAGITALLLPMDWTIQSVSFDGDYGPEDMVYLHPDSIDIQPAAGTDFWRDSLAAHWPPPEGMDWYVYQGLETYASIGDSGTQVTFTYEVTTGAAGEYNLGYYVSTADLGFAETTYYDVSLANTITVEGAGAIGDGDAGIARSFGLDQNYPNPFNPGTKIRYEIERPVAVNITVYDLTGKKVAELVNAMKTAGSHEVSFDGTDLPSGIYIYKMTAGSFSQIRKMTLIK